MREFQESSVENNSKKKKKPEELEKIIMICLEVLVQYMEHESHHVRKFCLSES